MLADRFHIQAHLEDRDDAVYALRVAPGGREAQPSPTARLVTSYSADNALLPTVTPGSFSTNMNSLELKINGAVRDVKARLGF